MEFCDNCGSVFFRLRMGGMGVVVKGDMWVVVQSDLGRICRDFIRV